MIPLNEHNAREARKWLDRHQPHPNGIACPECGEELIDSSPNVTLSSNPAPEARRVHGLRVSWIKGRLKEKQG
jgi:hypothetical protein